MICQHRTWTRPRCVGERRIEIEAVADDPGHQSVPFRVQTRSARVVSADAGAMISISSPAATETSDAKMTLAVVPAAAQRIVPLLTPLTWMSKSVCAVA